MNEKQRKYDKDFYAWAMDNAKLLREGKLSDVDIENVAEEVESMGKSEKRELLSRLSVLIAHLLKWSYQPIKRSKSGELTIQEQRFELIDLLNDSPSLKRELEKQLSRIYQKALIIAEKETGLEQKMFPANLPFPLQEILNLEFFPGKNK
jgi:hypothetical protein